LPKPIKASANNIWGIGRIVFELMTHIQGTDFGKALVINESKLNNGDSDDESDNEKSHENFVARRSFSAKLDKWHQMLKECVHEELIDTFPFSEGLRQLVADMLHPLQGKRPPVDEIERRAKDGLQTLMGDLAGVSKKSTKGQATKKNKLEPLYYRQEDWASINAGVIKWSEKSDKELDFLRAWARHVFAQMDPDGPLIKRPKWMKDPRTGKSEPWERVTDLARTMVVKSQGTQVKVHLDELELDRKPVAKRKREVAETAEHQTSQAEKGSKKVSTNASAHHLVEENVIS
jgi:hypothetical protein